MKIIDRNKDYYDYLVGIYGMDEKVVYLRNSTDVQAMIDYCINQIGEQGKFAKKFWKIFRKQPLITPKYYWMGNCPPSEDDKILFLSKHHFKYRLQEEGDDTKLHDLKYEYFTKSMELVIGHKRYYIEVLRYLTDDGGLYYDMLWEERPLKKRFSDAPIYLRCEDCIIPNPLLKNTFIASIISPEDIWIEVENYISSQNNEKDQDNMTNNEKILSHGFDLKTSFRKVK